MKKILFTLLAITTLAVALPAMAQEQTDSASSDSLTRVQQIKEYVKIETVNNSTGASVIFSGINQETSAKLSDIYANELFKRGWQFGNYAAFADMTVTPTAGGFSVNINCTESWGADLIQKSFADMDFLAKFTLPMAQFLANHGI
ncbi:hypothetical protein KJ840_05280 [Patescibacteria group bacterium]|nr:hypothetical protein [Patescibacteria group bacterium]